MKILKNGTFCVLPFIHEYQTVDNECRFCCYSNTVIDSVESVSSDILRQKILAGEKIPHCSYCYQQDQRQEISPRIRESVRWLKDTEIKNYIDNWSPGKTKVFFYDIMIDNKCNLACVCCNPEQSSLWAKELGITKNFKKTDYNFEKMLKSKKIYLAGGEPLIIDQLIELLERIGEQAVQPEIVINTNLSRINDRIIKILKKIKNLTLTVSVDGFEKINEYHRWPLSWDKFIYNLKCANDIGCTIQFNSVVDAITILNIDKLIQIENFTQMWSLSNLVSPEALKINNLPEDIKHTAILNFKNIKFSKFYLTDLSFQRTVDSIIENIFSPGDPQLLSMYIEQLDKRRKIDHQTYLGIKLT
jgi:uncharacterized Fe-S cluster-containing radical SAM superfamily protein